MTLRETAGQRLVNRIMPNVLWCRRPRRFKVRGWMSVDVTHWKKKLARAIDRSKCRQ